MPLRIESSPSDGPDRPLLEVGQAGRQRAGPQDEREVVGLLRREACPR